MPHYGAFDRKIIAILQKDGRTSSAQIARRLGLGERTVRNRIQHLVNSGAIQTTILVNPRTFGYQTILDIFCEIDFHQTEVVCQSLCQLPELNYIASATGDQDISIQVLLKSPEDIHPFMQKLSNIQGIRRTRTVLVPRVIKNINEWLPPDSDFEMES